VRFQLTDLVRVTSFLGRGGHNRNTVLGLQPKHRVDKNCAPTEQGIGQSKDRRAPGANRLKAHGKGWALKKPLVFPVAL
jgi:hypothetical protein